MPRNFLSIFRTPFRSIRFCKQKHSHSDIERDPHARGFRTEYHKLFSAQVRHLHRDYQNDKTLTFPFPITIKTYAKSYCTEAWPEEISWDLHIKIKENDFNQMIQIMGRVMFTRAATTCSHSREPSYKQSHLKRNFGFAHVTRSQIFVFKQSIIIIIIHQSIVHSERVRTDRKLKMKIAVE